MDYCGLLDYMLQHDKFLHCLVLELGLILIVRIFDNLVNGFNFKELLKVFMRKLLIIIICVIVKCIDYLTISNELIYELVVGFYAFESACELFLLGSDYGLPLPDKLKELIEKYIVK